MSYWYENDDERRRDWFERGMISPEEYWRKCTNEERDRLVLEDLNSGHLTTEDPEYADYYERRLSGRPIKGTHSPENLARFPWLED